MRNGQDYIFKIATEDWEFGRIFELNHATFAEEVPQHEPNTSRRLIDRFHEQNTYFICLKGSELIGMVALRDRRPFSLDQKCCCLAIPSMLTAEGIATDVSIDVKRLFRVLGRASG